MKLLCRLGRHRWDRLEPRCARCGCFREHGMNEHQKCREGTHDWNLVKDGLTGQPVLFCGEPWYRCSRCLMPQDALMTSSLCLAGRHEWMHSRGFEGQSVYRCRRCDLDRGWNSIGSRWEYFRCEHGRHQESTVCVIDNSGTRFSLGVCNWCDFGRDAVRQMHEAIAAEQDQ